MADPKAPPSMAQGLNALLGNIGSMMSAPDADIQFLTVLQHTIAAKIKQSTQGAMNPPGPGGIRPGGGQGMGGLVNQGALQQMGAMGPGGPPGGPGGPPGGMPGPGPGGPGGPMAGGPGGGGIPPSGQAPNPDELRRVLGANSQVG